MSVYDVYDPYNSNPYDSSPRYKSNSRPAPAPVDNGYRSSASMHDPVGYRAPSLQDPAGYRAPSLQAEPAGYRAPSLQDYRPNYPNNPPPTNGYNYPDYKPVPPPKSNAYKPVPPPKPKSSNDRVPESNYMNSNNNGGYASSVHYHSSNINNKPMFMNGNNHRYSDDVDSGQGSSLDRDYGLYNNYPKPNNNNHSRNQQQDQYYYNLPQHQNGGTPPRRDGLDLTNNREYRGSAFELYKKPLSEAKPQNQYYSNQTVAR